MLQEKDQPKLKKCLVTYKLDFNLTKKDKKYFNSFGKQPK